MNNIKKSKYVRKTKIICTLGPATDSDEVLRALMLGGMNVARQNFSHGDHSGHRVTFNRIRKLAEELQLPIATLLDTKGPEVRVKHFRDGKVSIKSGDTFTLTTLECEGTAERVSITYKDLPNDIDKETRILADDGLLEFKVTDIVEITDSDGNRGHDIICTVITGGDISNNKSCNFPGKHLSMPYISERDKSDLIFGCEMGFDFIAASFVSTADEIVQIRKLLEENGGGNIQIIAKIENQSGVDNIDDILRVSDGIMVARGDMGVEISFEHLPSIQKRLATKGLDAGKIVITATQMLDSMIRNPRPTRAETSDVANAIYDNSSAIMLSGETAAGHYPVEALHAMATIAEYTEKNINYVKRFKQRGFPFNENITNSIANATVQTSITLDAKAILTATESGRTARSIAKFRPPCPIISCTTSDTTYHQLALNWGVVPVMGAEAATTDELIDNVVESSKEIGIVKDGDIVVITAGVPLGVSGATNLMKVHVAGGVLVRGRGITRTGNHGPVCVLNALDNIDEKPVADSVVVVKDVTLDMVSHIRKAAAIITESDDGNDSHAATIGLTLDIPVIVGADGACDILKNNTVVRVDAESGTVSVY